MNKRAMIQVHKAAGDSAITITCEASEMSEVVAQALRVYAELPDHTMVGDGSGMRVFSGLRFELPNELQHEDDED